MLLGYLSLFAMRTFFSKRSTLSISEVMEFTKSDFDKSSLCELARAAVSEGLMKFDGHSVDLKDTPNLDKLLKELFR